MKKIALFFISFCFIFISSAQNKVTLLKDELGKTREAASVANGLLQGLDDQYYVYNEDFYDKAGKGMVADAIFCIDKNGATMNEIKVTHPEDYEFVKFYEDQDDIFAIYKTYKWKTKTFGLYMNTIGKDQSAPAWDPEELVKVQTERNEDLYAFSSVSPDNTKLVVSLILAGRKGNMKGSSVMTFGADGAKLWDNTLSLEFNNPNFKILNMIISNDAEVFVTLASYGDVSRKTREDETFHLYKITSDNVVFVDEKIPFGFISNAESYINKKGEVVAAGYYCTDLTEYEGGTYAVVFDNKTEQLKDISHQDFAPEYAIQEKAALGVPKNTKFTVNPDHIYEFNDGSYALIGEQQQVIIRTTTSPNGMTTSTYTYYAKNILVSFLDEDGKIDDFKMIKKLQIVGPGRPLTFKRRQAAGYSFTSFMLNNNIHLFFQDHIDNYSGRADVPCRASSSSNHCTVHTTIQEDKSLTSKVVIDPNKSDIRMIAPLFLEDNGMLLINANKKVMQLSKLSLSL